MDIIYKRGNLHLNDDEMSDACKPNEGTVSWLLMERRLRAALCSWKFNESITPEACLAKIENIIAEETGRNS